LVSESASVATTDQSDFILDVPEPNTAAVRMAQKAGMKNIFETARMYRGDAPAYNLEQLYGVTTFELG